MNGLIQCLCLEKKKNRKSLFSVWKHGDFFSAMFLPAICDPSRKNKASQTFQIPQKFYLDVSLFPTYALSPQ